MSNKPKLIIISGSPCVGKTTVADRLFCSYKNSAHLDDDWVWRVNPFGFDDPRNLSINKNIAYVLSNYLNLNFDYVVLSSVRTMYQNSRESILRDITAKDYMTIGFTLTCSEETLIKRHKIRGDETEVSFEWLRMKPYPGDYVINTDNKSVEQVASEIREIIDRLYG